ncbi:MAG: T9SS type A sorting domain-containing protein [Candidatus Kapabacteria bacterium]|nr:T9SS type A sorting domain-containing protein [Ignavibacteriota bacterium]MCW5884682.1 T9SS type A sorting domain-containing protein [Candidatus Kapabacteria bacterium]
MKRSNYNIKFINADNNYIKLSLVLILSLIFFNLSFSDDETKQYRPIGKPLLRYNDFLERRFDTSNVDRSFRIRANEQLQSMQNFTKEYFDILQSSQPDWKNIGPFDIGGRVRTIAVHPTNPNILYIGAAAGGIWKSTNGAISWMPMFDFEDATSFGSISIDPNNPEILYAATGEMIIGGGIPYLGDGIYKTTDSGNSWFQIGLTEVAAFSKLYVHPLNSSIIYAAGVVRNGGVYRSSDAGLSWEKLCDGNITDLSINPNDINEIFAGVNAVGLMYSSDGGVNWLERSQGLTQLGGRVSVQAFSKNTSILYALIERADSRGAVFKSTNKGKSWTMVLNGNQSFFNSQGYYNNYISIHPDNPDIVLAGGIELWRTRNGGASWDVMNNRTSPSTMHVDQHHAVYAPSNNNIVYVANDGGIYKSTNTGQNWLDMNKGLMITQFYAFTVNQRQVNQNFGGTQDHGTVGNPGNNWKMVVGGDGFDCFFHPSDQNILFGEIYYGDVFRYNIRNDNFTFLRNGLPSDDIGAWHSPFVLDERTHNIYLGRNAIYVSYNYGDYFYQFSPKYNHQFTAIGVNKLNSRIMYAGNRVGNIIRTTDAGISWETLNTSNLPGKYITEITTSSFNENIVYVSYSGYGHRHIFKSEDYGNSWRPIDLMLPDVPVNSILLHPENESIIFAGTDVGVFMSGDGGENWMPYGSNLPRTPILDLKFHNNRVLLPKLTLRAATYGRSIWEIEVPDQLIPESEIVSPSGIENYIGGSSADLSWFGFEYPVRVEFTYDASENWILVADSVFTNHIKYKLPDINTFSARFKVTSLKNGVSKISRTFSIKPKYPGAILFQNSLGYNSYGLVCDTKNRILVVDYRNGIVYFYDNKTFELLKKISSPVPGFYTDITLNSTDDRIFLHKMSDESGSDAEIIIIDTLGNLISRIQSPAVYPMGLAFDNNKLYISERDGQKRIFEMNLNNDFEIKYLLQNPVTADFGPRCFTYSGGTIHQVSTFFNNTNLTKSEISIFSPYNQVYESIPLVESTGVMNARGIDIDKEDGNYWVSTFTGSIYKIASGNELSSISHEFQNNIKVFPNPTGEFLKINFESSNNILNQNITIYNLHGIEIQNITNINSSNLKIDVSKYSQGVYFIKIGNAVRKFVKI